MSAVTHIMCTFFLLFRCLASSSLIQCMYVHILLHIVHIICIVLIFWCALSEMETRGHTATHHQHTHIYPANSGACTQRQAYSTDSTVKAIAIALRMFLFMYMPFSGYHFFNVTVKIVYPGAIHLYTYQNNSLYLIFISLVLPNKTISVNLVWVSWALGARSLWPCWCCVRSQWPRKRQEGVDKTHKRLCPGPYCIALQWNFLWFFSYFFVVKWTFGGRNILSFSLWIVFFSLSSFFSIGSLHLDYPMGSRKFDFPFTLNVWTYFFPNTKRESGDRWNWIVCCNTSGNYIIEFSGDNVNSYSPHAFA